MCTIHKEIKIPPGSSILHVRQPEILPIKYFALNAMTIYWGVKYGLTHSSLHCIHPFWSASHSGHFTPGKEPIYTLFTKLCSLQSQSGQCDYIAFFIFHQSVYFVWYVFLSQLIEVELVYINSSNKHKKA